MLERLKEQAGQLTPQRTFAVLASVFGLAFLLIVPPFQAPDEPRHFLRAYQVSELHVKGVKVGGLAGDYLPEKIVAYSSKFSTSPEKVSSLWDRGWSAGKLPEQGNRRVFVEFPNTVIYSPANYAPQAAAIAAGRLFNANPPALLYLARLAGLTAWIALTYFAIRIIPVGKWLITGVSLLPMALFEAASASADNMVFGMTTLTIAAVVAYVTAERHGRQRPSLWLLLPLAFLIGLIKLPYGLVCLVLLIPFLQRGKPRRLVVPLIALGLMAITTLGWAIFTKGLYVVPASWPTTPTPGVNPPAQIHALLEHPFYFPVILFKTVTTGVFDPIWYGLVGLFGWASIPLYAWAVVLAYVGLGVILVGPRERLLRWRERLVLLGTFLATSAAILTLLYISWTPVGVTMVYGSQSRYFLPLASLLAAAVGDQVGLSLRRKAIYASILLTVVFAAVWELIRVYYRA